MNLEQKYNIFLDKNNDEFIKLYIQERLRLGIGCLFGDCSKDNNEIDIRYIPYDNIPSELKNDLKKKMDMHNDSSKFLYCFFYDANDSVLIELNLEKINKFD